MEREQLVENSSINETIYRCLEYIQEKDREKFLRKFCQLKNVDNQFQHTYRELLIGAFLVSRKNGVHYNKEIDNQTPDWILQDKESGIQCIIEVVNFHLNNTLEQGVIHNLENEHSSFVAVPPNNQRLHQAIERKIEKYTNLVSTQNTPYIVVLSSLPTADVNSEEPIECLDGESGLFKNYRILTGVMLVYQQAFPDELIDRYVFKHVFEYFANPRTIRPYSLP
jgi:hypothetical protein